MAIQVTETPDGLKLSLAGVLTARLFGIPFLGIGAWLFVQGLLGLLSVVSDRDLELLPGGLLALGLGALFLLPGVILMFGRGWVEIDRKRQQLVEVRSYGFWRARGEHPLAAFERLEATSEPSSRSGGPGRVVWTPQLDIVGKDGRKVLLGLGSSEAEVVAVGKRLAGELGLPFVDRLEVSAEAE